MDNEDMRSQMEDFLYRLKNADKGVAHGREMVEALATKIEFTFIMVSNKMGYLDSLWDKQ
jgi:ribosomal protein S8